MHWTGFSTPDCPDCSSSMESLSLGGCSLLKERISGFRTRARLPSPKSLTAYPTLECYCHFWVRPVHCLTFIWQVISLRYVLSSFPRRGTPAPGSTISLMPCCSNSYGQPNQNSDCIPQQSLFLTSHAQSG